MMRMMMQGRALMIVALLLALGFSNATGNAQSSAPGEKAAKKTTKNSADGKKTTEATPPQADVVTSIPFGETNNGIPFNASGVVEISPGQFLFCDNKIREELLEFRLDDQGKKVGPVVRRPLSGVDPAAIKDLEGLTMVERNGDRFLVATSSFNRLHDSQGKKMVPLDGYAGGLLRIRLGSDNTLVAENIPGFREWLISKYPQLKASAHLVPDEGGLNIEGLEWDSNRGALLFGLRTPLNNGKPVILPVRLKGDQWRLEDFEPLPAITLQIQSAEYKGVRSVAYAPAHKVFVISLGKATSIVKAPFALYVWDGGDSGQVRKFERLHFARGMRIEGLAGATVNGKRAILLIDDGGGYQVIAEDDPRLR